MDNKKRKIKFNIIDIIIIALIICAAVFLVMKFSDGGIINDATSNSKARITFFMEECADFVVPNSHIGDPLYDASNKVELGTVTDIQVGESVTYVELDDGTVVASPKEGYCSVYITGETLGTFSDYGVTVDGTLYGVGHTLVLYAGVGKYYLQVYSIEKID